MTRLHRVTNENTHSDFCWCKGGGRESDGVERPDAPGPTGGREAAVANPAVHIWCRSPPPPYGDRRGHGGDPG